ncbi:MAG: c-type cytochrome [Aquabacterium sp.]|nr:c-type cytochrome [Aquabacterium sp.]
MVFLLTSALLSSLALAAPKARQAEAKSTKTVVLKGDPVVGREKADSERCVECHGLKGQGAEHPNSAEAKFAKLAGQYPDYILKQIRDFRSGARKHDQMAIMARSVSDEDVLDIAAYFASQQAMNGKDGDLHEIGKELYQAGDAARGIPACASCHGANGKGLQANKLAPIVGGQEWRYLDKQLRDWRSGERRNSPDGAMNKATAALTDKEIESLADYLSGL